MGEDAFNGFGAGACDWFAALEVNNRKDWFEANRAAWEDGARAPMEAFMAELAARFGSKTKLFRPYRDVRFSKDKTPYKTNVAGVLTPPSGAAMRYASLDSAGLFVGAGYHGMARDQVDRFRAAAAGPAGAALADHVAALKSAGLEQRGQGVKTAPRGYDRDHERIELIRLKELFAGALLQPDKVTDAAAVRAHADHVWEAAAPMLDWLDAHVGPCRMDPEAAFARR